MKNKKLKIISAIALAIILVLLVFFINYAIKSTRSKSTLGKTETLYRTDESASRISNIPYEKYVKFCNLTKGATILELDEDAKGEVNSQKINEAIAKLSKNGGGTVGIPIGEYKISTIELKSNITLFVPDGTKLISLTCYENENSESPLRGAVVIANDAKNVTITGGGEICGSGVSYTKDAKVEKPLYALEKFNLYTRVVESTKRVRPAKNTERNSIVNFSNCSDVHINNIILSESALWTLVIDNCDNVNINNTVIDNNMHVANTDGIDITGGNNIKIKNCFIATGDDGIVLKPKDYSISNVTVSNCVISSFANCFKIGAETQKDVDNVKVYNCDFFIPDGMTYGFSGIAVESADGSNISNVNIDNITMDGVSSPLLIWLGNRMEYDNNTVGSISDISISNVSARNTEMPSVITGCKAKGKTYYIENVSLKDFKVTYRNTGENLSVKKSVSEASMNGYPEVTRVSHNCFINHSFSSYWDLPCYGIFVRHTKNTDYSGYTCTPRECSELKFAYTED